ncbi:hypothetical protein [uncultured Algibacter sp.]|uniref:hypothetical protein n=1 Tax=uncultured Algibacter sp. TaxID=298659 RepID=UPI003217E347
MKQYLKIALLTFMVSMIVINSKQISKRVINEYETCIAFMSGNTIGQPHVLGI